MRKKSIKFILIKNLATYCLWGLMEQQGWIMAMCKGLL